MDNNLISDDYKDFIGDIKNKIRNSQYEAMKVVNQTLINLYWGIGQEIYIQQQEKGWGKSIVEVLAGELKKEFPEVKKEKVNKPNTNKNNKNTKKGR